MDVGVTGGDHELMLNNNLYMQIKLLLLARAEVLHNITETTLFFLFYLNRVIILGFNMRERLKSKFIGCLVGLAVGDFLGAGGGRYTDDTAMMIGVAESLIDCKGFNGEKMAKRFVENYYKEPWRGYGPGPPKIFRAIKSGRKWDENLDRELYPGGSYGNGVAMRVAPIGLFYYDDPDKLRDVAYQSSKITHSHPLGMEGAALQAYAVALATVREVDQLDKYEF